MNDNILLLGDVHADIEFFERACLIAKREQIGTILQLGDFGAWPRWTAGAKFLADAKNLLNRHDLECYWIDGNHDDHDSIAEGFRTKGRLVYVPRGARWEWGGRKFLACGGAYSIDRKYRTKFWDWFPTEVISDADVDRCIEPGPCEILVTHDAPISVRGCLPPGAGDLYPESQPNREQVQRIVDATRPYLVVHGHYHHRYTEFIDYTVRIAHGHDGPVNMTQRVEGFACNGMQGSMGVLDIETFRVTEVDSE